MSLKLGKLQQLRLKVPCLQVHAGLLSCLLPLLLPMLCQDASGKLYKIKFIDNCTCERCMVVKDSFIEEATLEDCLDKANVDDGENAFESEWQYTEGVVDGVLPKLWKPSTISKETENSQALELMLLFLNEYEYSTYFLAQSDKIPECRRGTLTDFNEASVHGILLRPNPTKDIKLDLRALFDKGLDPAKQVITLQMDNSENAFRRIILRRAIGSKRSYFTMTSESEVRAAQADKTWAWLVTDGNGKDRIQDLTFNHNYFLCC